MATAADVIEKLKTVAPQEELELIIVTKDGEMVMVNVEKTAKDIIKILKMFG